MQTPARYKAVAELLETIFTTQNPADNIMNEYFRNRRYIGSKDRRFIAEETWNILRHFYRLEFDAQSNNIRKILLVYLREQNLSEIFSGSEYAMTPLTQEEQTWLQNISDTPYPPATEAECPDWIYEKLNDFALFKSLTNPATADFRINNANRETIIEKLSFEGIDAEKTPLSPIGIRLQNRINLNNCQTFLDGYIEPQDEASQLTAILADVKENNKVIDYCCGAGGKSLAIAALLKNKGKIEAHDINPRRMEPLFSRMNRLHISNIFPITTDKISDDYDCFIIDAPCSGTGTWRRSPDAKFRLSKQKLNELVSIQQNILEFAAQKTKTGGKIVYITCSILPEENNLQIENFLAQNPDFQKTDLSHIWQQKIGTPYPFADTFYLQFSPLSTGTDGMFIAVLQKTA
ncbi:MAG: RsmB/NOP family class I SAM-dependent RNA methyltransferase [Alphaproteobacteria bacterium]|nr:RsmB/NOP family class I SAM-dependent RNA methyltransferase [Alphaproteobacteria bacterium]